MRPSVRGAAKQRAHWNRTYNGRSLCLIQFANTVRRSLELRSTEPDLGGETAPPDLFPPPQPPKAARRPQHMNYTKFDGILLSPSPSMDLGPHSPSRKICMDNLPIDVTESEIREAVSFFGPAADVTIYNQRPDLDPGEDNVPKLRPRKAGYWANTLDKEVRKETPVYAFVEFEEDGGESSIYRLGPISTYTTRRRAVLIPVFISNAVNCSVAALEKSYTDNVRIFGVVIRQHCSSVSVVEELDTLYLEIPANEEGAEEPSLLPRDDSSSSPPHRGVEHSLEIEMRLRDVMGTDIFIVMGLGEHEWATPTTVEVKLPSHEVASWAKGRIEESEECRGAGYKVNWFRTRPDAMKHWKREVMI